MKRMLAIGILLVTGGVSLAQTPDGAAPANEGVCDLLKADGVTKGLYGLCVAFCEAQDMDFWGELTDPPRGRLLELYEKKRGVEDPNMPCIAQNTCPCWTADEVSLDFVAGREGLLFVDNYAGTVDSGAVRLNAPWSPPDLRAQRIVVTAFSSGSPRCLFLDNPSGTLRDFRMSEGTLTADQATACVAQASQLVELLGLQCGDNLNQGSPGNCD
jgi:hypothetical protein